MFSAGITVRERATGDLFFIHRLARSQVNPGGSARRTWLAQKFETEDVILIDEADYEPVGSNVPVALPT